MTRGKKSSAAFRKTVLTLALLAAGAARAQVRTPARLIELVSLPPSDPDAGFICPSLQVDDIRARAPAKALVHLGTTAIPEIEKSFDSLEELGNSSPFFFGVGWLADVYAKILGPAAFPRLRRMMNNVRLRQWERDFETGVSVALGLTSYVDSRSTQATKICSPEDPRDGLDRFLLAWEHNDVKGLEGSVGPDTQASLKVLSKKISQGESSRRWHWATVLIREKRGQSQGATGSSSGRP